MTSETLNLHVSKNLNISNKTKQDIEKLKAPLGSYGNVVFDASKIESTIFHRRGTLTIFTPDKNELSPRVHIKLIKFYARL